MLATNNDKNNSNYPLLSFFGKYLGAMTFTYHSNVLETWLAFGEYPTPIILSGAQPELIPEQT